MLTSARDSLSYQPSPPWPVPSSYITEWMWGPRRELWLPSGDCWIPKGETCAAVQNTPVHTWCSSNIIGLSSTPCYTNLDAIFRLCKDMVLPTQFGDGWDSSLRRVAFLCWLVVELCSLLSTASSGIPDVYLMSLCRHQTSVRQWSSLLLVKFHCIPPVCSPNISTAGWLESG